jgi:hypothetical protein
MGSQVSLPAFRGPDGSSPAPPEPKCISNAWYLILPSGRWGDNASRASSTWRRRRQRGRPRGQHRRTEHGGAGSGRRARGVCSRQNDE